MFIFTQNVLFDFGTSTMKQKSNKLIIKNDSS